MVEKICLMHPRNQITKYTSKLSLEQFSVVYCLSRIGYATSSALIRKGLEQQYNHPPTNN